MMAGLTCLIEGCGKAPGSARGWCPAHYQRWRKYGDPLGVAAPRKPLPKRSCSVAGCDEDAVARGWCKKHHKKWRRYGSPSAVAHASPGEPMRWITEVALAFCGDECLTWPFATSKGYGRIWTGKFTDYAHKVVCQLAHGPAPRPNSDAAHACGNGHIGCVNPRHLSWKSRSDNSADRLLHGTDHRGEKHPNVKLTEGDVRKIRALKGQMGVKEMAKEFNISAWQVSNILRGRAWVWLK